MSTRKGILPDLSLVSSAAPILGERCGFEQTLAPFSATASALSTNVVAGCALSANVMAGSALSANTVANRGISAYEVADRALSAYTVAGSALGAIGDWTGVGYSSNEWNSWGIVPISKQSSAFAELSSDPWASWSREGASRFYGVSASAMFFEPKVAFSTDWGAVVPDSTIERTRRALADLHTNLASWPAGSSAWAHSGPAVAQTDLVATLERHSLLEVSGLRGFALGLEKLNAHVADVIQAGQVSAQGVPAYNLYDAAFVQYESSELVGAATFGLLRELDQRYDLTKATLQRLWVRVFGRLARAREHAVSHDRDGSLSAKWFLKHLRIEFGREVQARSYSRRNEHRARRSLVTTRDRVLQHQFRVGNSPPAIGGICRCAPCTSGTRYSFEELSCDQIQRPDDGEGRQWRHPIPSSKIRISSSAQGAAALARRSSATGLAGCAVSEAA